MPARFLLTRSAACWSSLRSTHRRCRPCASSTRARTWPSAPSRGPSPRPTLASSLQPSRRPRLPIRRRSSLVALALAIEQLQSAELPPLFVQHDVFIGTEENFAELLKRTSFAFVEFCWSACLYCSCTDMARQTAPSAATARSWRWGRCVLVSAQTHTARVCQGCWRAEKHSWRQTHQI